MTDSWNIGGLLSGLTLRDRHPAVIAFGAEGSETWDSATVADKARRLAGGLRDAGIGGSARVALWGPNSPVWIVGALAVLTVGGVVVPIDDLADAEQLDAALVSSTPRAIFTTAHHLEADGEILRKHAVRVVLLDGAECSEGTATGWASLLGERTEDLPTPDEPALLSWTSGTTGSPKAFFLTHRNIATNVEALQKLNVVGPQDRALLPLPLHHAYPFIVGMLTTLTIGTAIVLPGGTAGPLLVRAMREAEVTTIIGVPRLYDAIWTALETRVSTHGRTARFLWRALLQSASLVQRSTGLRLGRLLFAPVRRGIAARLRLLVSGGSRLEKETEDRLEALGWTVLSGYGLAETASLFTGNRPDARRPGSVGRPLADGEVRIADPDEEGIGEIELHGSSITKGYLDNPEANQAAFTADGWYRTGDLGFVDRDGFLFVTGREKEVIVLGGGKKVAPEDLEPIYGGAPEIAEMAVLEDKGALVALVRPDRAKLHDRGATNLRDGIRVILAEKARDLPSWQRLSGFALTDQPLPRTRLGKYQRFLLPALYAEALIGGNRRAAHALTPDDLALLRDPTAEAIWALLRERYPDEALDLDVDLALDLNVDSFGWMEIAVALQDRLDIQLSEPDIAGIRTIRELLFLAIERRSGARAPLHEEPAMATDFERWLAPTGPLLAALALVLYALNRLVMRGLFRLRVIGTAKLPETGAFVITPNHVSDLDGLVIGAALPWSGFRRLYWAGDAVRMFSNPLNRLFCRAMHVFPVDANHPGAVLESARRVLKAGQVQVWFPEAWRSPDGMLQRFLPGVGQLLLRSGAPAVPALIKGAFEALPRGRRVPRIHPITVVFASPEPVEILRGAGTGRTDEERIADALRQRVIALGAASGAAIDAEAAVVDPLIGQTDSVHVDRSTEMPSR
ncbi:MAG: AMP-binding protein [Alphaproteobacteria bacterium]|nr:AMP-binding protein [Alphaproteobacteria bacterium]